MHGTARAVDTHLADSLSALKLLRGRQLETVVDVGSGAGFPGLPIAIAMPAEVDLLEATARKCAFLDRAIEAIGLENTRVVCARAEEWGVAEGRDRYVPAALVAGRGRRRCRRWSNTGSRCFERVVSLVAWKGRRDAVEETAAATAARHSGCAPPRSLRSTRSRAQGRGTCTPSRRSVRRRRNIRGGRGSRASVPSGADETLVRARHFRRGGCVGEETGFGAGITIPKLGHGVPTGPPAIFGAMATVYAVANQKGGVGKTTTAVNMAACVAEAGYATLLVDLDPQCNATVALGLAQDARPEHLHLSARGGSIAEAARRRPAIDNLEVVPVDPGPGRRHRRAAAHAASERRLGEALAPVRDASTRSCSTARRRSVRCRSTRSSPPTA